jgi:hypothetical protein
MRDSWLKVNSKLNDRALKTGPILSRLNSILVPSYLFEIPTCISKFCIQIMCLVSDVK